MYILNTGKFTIDLVHRHSKMLRNKTAISLNPGNALSKINIGAQEDRKTDGPALAPLMSPLLCTHSSYRL